jgi:hypothetical protein
MKKNTTTPEKTVLTIVVGFLILHFFTKEILFFWFAIVIGCIGVLSPFIATYIHRFWMFLSHVLGLIFPKIVLTLLFFFVLFPIALLAKIFSKNDPLMLKNNRGSTFINVQQSFPPYFFEKLW